MRNYYMKDDEGLIIDDCQAATKEEAKAIFLERGYQLPFSIEE